MPNKKINIIELAKRAAVSTATISRALNAETRLKVAPATRELIEKLAKQYGYTPSLAAKHLSGKKFRTIGVLFPHHQGMLLSDYYTQILAGVSDALLTSDFRMKMVLLKPGQKPWDHYDFKNGEGVDGLIVTYWRSFFESPAAFKKIAVPCVIINNVEKQNFARFVAGDHYRGAQMAAKLFYDRGHRHFAILSGQYESPDVKEKLAGFKDYLAARGVRIGSESFYDVNYEEERAYEKTREILSKRPKVTAFFCMNDVQAYGVLRRLRDLSVPCPKKVSVIGYDDDRRSAYAVPPLTTVRVPVYELARKAAEDLIQESQNPNPGRWALKFRLPVQLIERESVA